MKFTVNRSDLHVAMTQANRVVERRSTIPIIQNVRLSAEGDELCVTATDLDIEIRVRVPATIEAPGGTTLPAGLLSGLVAKLKEGVVTIEATGAAQASVGQGRTRAKMACLPVDDFPNLGDFDQAATTFTMPPARFAEALTATRGAVSTEETRYYLNGIHLHAVGRGADARLSFVATDGHRLAVWRGPLPDGAHDMPAVIVPRKTVDELRKIVDAAANGDDAVVVAVSETKIRFEVGKTILTSKLIDGVFPDYERIMPRHWDSEAIVDRAELAAAIGRVSCVLAERSKGIAFAFDDGRLTVTARNPDQGDIEEEAAFFQADDRLSKLTIGFQSRYVSDALDALPFETITFRLPETPGDPTTLVPATPTDATRLVVLMPLQVK